MSPSAEDVMLWAHQQAVRQGASNKPKAPRGKKSKTPKPENAVVKACLQYLQILGCFVWRNNTGGYNPYSDSSRVVRYGKVGSGDLIGVTPSGRFITVECKAGNNKQSDYQIDFQRRVEASNGVYILAYSVDDIEKRRGDILQ